MLQRFPILIILLTAMISSCKSQHNAGHLKEQIMQELAKYPGTYAVAFKDIQSGEEILINGHQRFHAASTMKTPVMIEVLRQAEQGRYKLSQQVTVKNEFRSIVDNSIYSLDSAEDSDKEIYSRIGKGMMISELLRDMIIKSSNLATNMLIEMAGAANVNNTMRQLGAHDIQVLRGVEDGKAFEKGLNNSTTAYDLMLIFEKIAKDQVVSPQACQQMREILMDQHFNSILPARLPKEVKVAHKTGNITGVEHDGGIVYMKDGRSYVLILLSKDIPNAETTQSMLAGISRMMYDYASQQ